jgi:diadenosine tetraphosphatase ApaH/serine/threonine PP2A family protein phosphatase
VGPRTSTIGDATGVLALLYDVHGNLPALDAVLADARDRGAQRFVLGGDYALFGPWPADTVARLRNLDDAAWIRGNGERWTAAPSEAAADGLPEPARGALEACREALGEDLVAELAALPFDHAEGGARFCHASPVSDMRSFLPEPGEDEAELLQGVGEDLLVFGHTHLPFRRAAATGTLLVNPGSVGMPFDGDPRAAYALLREGGEVEHRRVEYDHRASAAAVRANFSGEWTELIAGRIERARP